MKDFILNKMPFISGMAIGAAIMALSALQCAVLIASLVLATLIFYILGLGKGDIKAPLRRLATIVAIILVIRRCIT